MKKQVIFLSKREVTHGMKAGRKWTLYGYKDEDGMEYTSFQSDYPLNEPQEIEYEEKEVPSRDGTRTFINRTLIEPKTGERMVKKEYDNGEKIVDLLGDILIEVKAIRVKDAEKH